MTQKPNFPNKHIDVYDLVKKFDEENLKAIQVYFDSIQIDDKLEFILNAEVLKLALVYKNGSQKMIEYNEFLDLFPDVQYLDVPKTALPNGTTLSQYKRLGKVYIKAEPVITTYKESKCLGVKFFNYPTIIVLVKNQMAFERFVDEREKVIKEKYKKPVQEHERLICNGISIDEIDEDLF